MSFWRHNAFLFLFALLIGGSAQALAEDGLSAVNLEEKIRDRISNSIRPSMSGREFIVSVKLSLKKQNPDQNNKAAPQDSQMLSLGKLDFSIPKVESEPGTTDLLSRIERLDVRVILDNEIPEDRRKMIGEIVRANIDPFLTYATGVQPKVTLDSMVFALPEKPKAEEKWDSKRWISEFKIPISVMLASLALAGVLLVAVFMGMRAYQNLETRKIAVLEAQNAREDARIQTEQQQRDLTIAPATIVAPSPEAAAPSAVSGSMTGALPGVERFKFTMKRSPEGAAALIRQWLKAPARGASEALSFLPKTLEVEEFVTLLGHLHVDERREWKRLLANGFDSSKSAAADAFISSQIVESLLMPAPEVPQDIRESLGRLKSNQCAEIASEDAELGAVMVTLMPSAQVAQMLAFMSPDAAHAVTMASLKMTESEVARRLQRFKAAAERVLSEKKSAGSEFTVRAAELLAEVSPEKEGSIFDALVESGEFDLLKTASRQFFPAQLVSKLPAPVIQACLERLPLSRRAELIFSRGEESAIYLEAVGPEGSKLREMVGVELNQVNSDELRRRKIEKTKETLWREFVALVRAMIRANDSLALQADLVLDPWLSEKSGGRIGGSAAA